MVSGLKISIPYLLISGNVLLLDVLIVQYQDRPELLGITYPHLLQISQDVVLRHFFDRYKKFIPSRAKILDVISTWRGAPIRSVQ